MLNIVIFVIIVYFLIVGYVKLNYPFGLDNLYFIYLIYVIGYFQEVFLKMI